ncbi:MAG: hypothetical protein QOG77_2896 [Solirubrobacteraceae bacterium]|nr:hypothetical protein [Solirubrobacteraceae bacterium]
MRIASLAILVLLVAAAPAAASERVVSRDGRVGDAQVGVSRAAAIQAAEGRPTQVRRHASGVRWTYACGRERGSTYRFDARGVLAEFRTTCRSWRTADGTRAGDGRAIAEFIEGTGAADAGCGLRIRRRGRVGLSVTFATRLSPVRALAVTRRSC